jgi:hypothetical protein
MTSANGSRPGVILSDTCIDCDCQLGDGCHCNPRPLPALLLPAGPPIPTAAPPYPGRPLGKGKALPYPYNGQLAQLEECQRLHREAAILEQFAADAKQTARAARAAARLAGAELLSAIAVG